MTDERPDGWTIYTGRYGTLYEIEEDIKPRWWCDIAHQVGDDPRYWFAIGYDFDSREEALAAGDAAIQEHAKKPELGQHL